MKHLTLLAAILLGGCAVASGGNEASAGAPVGYLYHDGNHMGGVSQPSPQALYNAAHGVWLWPPAESDRPG
ncbi:MAG: hypothetical protein WDN25_28670 [Acetobacteraceae bacterium]